MCHKTYDLYKRTKKTLFFGCVEYCKLDKKAIILVSGGEPIMSIALTRVDFRLIHGQVATVWSKEANAQRIIICSDEVAKDQIRKTLLLQVGPPGIKVSVVDVAKAVRVYNNPKYEKDTVFFLYTCPQDVLRMAEAGVPIKSVNIGGMAFKTGKTQITKAVSVDESDIAAFKKLHEMGIELEIRPVATDKKVDLMSKIEGIEG